MADRRDIKLAAAVPGVAGVCVTRILLDTRPNVPVKFPFAGTAPLESCLALRSRQPRGTMHTLTLTDEEAALLRLSLNHFAKWNDGEADRLRGWLNSSQPFHIERARRARELCERLEG